MSRVDYDAERGEMAAGIQAAFAEHEGALVVGWFLVAELRDATGKPYLAYRNGNVNGEGLNSWVSLGFLHSALSAVEEQSRDTMVTRDDDDEDPGDA